jgi:hypothetical protein
MKWNPRYVIYAEAHGNSPEKQSELDESEWPGGCMTGFILWMSPRIQDFNKSHEAQGYLPGTAVQCLPEEFDAFLAS